MEPWKHALLSLILAAALYPFFGLNVWVVFAGGVLIDIDHYLFYIFKTKGLSPLKCYRYFTTEAMENNHKHINGNFLVFHTVEFLLIALALSFYSQLALLFTAGLLGHYLLDFIWFKCFYKRFVLNPSIISWLIRKT
ncbi:hypothetical protein HYY70_00010 [Candidatus Woesearchaeota archaeon]|nr:hypothetical protein [Candidatus Woesearchaeota archaeon]